MHKYYVTIFTYMRLASLKNCIESVVKSIQKQERDTAILVIDNDLKGSAQTVVDYFKDKLISINIYYLKENNKGVVYARNAAINYFRGLQAIPLGLLWIDDDETADIHWVDELCKSLEYADLINGRVKLYWDSPSELDKIAGQLNSKGGKTSGKANAPLNTSNLAIGKKIIASSIKFDMWFNGKGGEDSDFSFRCQKLGFKLWYNHEAIVSEKQEGFRTTIEYRCKRARMANFVWQEIKKRHLKSSQPFLMLIYFLFSYFYHLTIYIVLLGDDKNRIKASSKLGGVLYYLNKKQSVMDY